MWGEPGSSHWPFSSRAAGLGYGGLIGTALGSLAGFLNAGRLRRQEMSEIGRMYDEAAAAGTTRPKTPDLSYLSALLLPLRGAHRTGQVEASKTMRGGKPIARQRGDMRDALYAGRHIPYLGSLLSVLHGYGQNLKTQRAVAGDR
jgi:hypothetical protein